MSQTHLCGILCDAVDSSIQEAILANDFVHHHRLATKIVVFAVFGKMIETRSRNFAILILIPTSITCEY